MSLYAIPSVDEINEQSDKPELTSQEDLGVQVASMLLEEVARGGVVDSTHQRSGFLVHGFSLFCFFGTCMLFLMIAHILL